MNKKLKEILDNLKNTADTSFFAICGTKEEMENMPKSISKALHITDKHAKLLYDYITNLQQENERLKYQLNQEKPNYLQIWQLEDRIYEASEFIKEKISSTKGVIDDYMYHKEHNQHLIELLNEDIEMYKNELNILEGEDKQ